MEKLLVRTFGETDQEIKECQMLQLTSGALQFPVSDDISIKIENVADPITLPEELFGPQVFQKIRPYG